MTHGTSASRDAVLVTGGSNGIGRATVLRLLDDGYEVFNLDIVAPDEPGAHETFVHADLTDEPSLRATLARLVAQRPITRLVNNAAIVRPASIDHATTADLQAVMAVNLAGPIACVQALLPAMRAARFGRIVNISSRAALGKREPVAYASVKAAVHGLTRTLALELGMDGISVNAIGPGPIASALFDRVNPPGAPATQQIIDAIPLRRMGQPSEVAHLVASLLDARGAASLAAGPQRAGRFRGGRGFRGAGLEHRPRIERDLCATWRQRLWVDRDPASAAETTALIHAEGGSAHTFVGDVALEADVERLFDQARSQFGPIDVLHHNVGIGKTGGPMETSAEDFDRIHSVNVRSLLLATQQVLPDMTARGRGSIVTISSVAGMRYIGYPHLAYSVTKAAVVQFTRMLAQQYAGSGIRANTVVPGLIDTPRIANTVANMFSAGNLDEARAARDQQVPMGKMGSAWDIAHACAFLASDAAAYITGTELVVDGGITGKYC